MLQTRMKKILIGTSGVLLLALGGVIVYNVFFLSGESSNTQSGSDNVAAQTGENSQTNASPVTSVPILGPKPLGSNTIKFYERDTGNVVQINGDGSGRKILDDVTIKNLQRVTWAPLSAFVATQSDGQYSTFNYKTKASNTFPPEVSNFHFVGDKVVYTRQTNNGASLVMADPDGSNQRILSRLTSDEISITPIPQTMKVGYVLKPSAYRASSLTVVSSSTDTSEALITDQYGLQVNWGPKGEKALLASTAQRGGSEMTFTVIDKEGNVQQTFGTGTVIEKTVWKDASTIYFTKPNLSKEVVMPDDYRKDNLGDFRESLYKLDLSSGTITKLIPDIGAVNSRNLFLNDSGTKLFFINQRDGRLYSVSLPSK